MGFYLNKLLLDLNMVQKLLCNVVLLSLLTLTLGAFSQAFNFQCSGDTPSVQYLNQQQANPNTQRIGGPPGKRGPQGPNGLPGLVGPKGEASELSSKLASDFESLRREYEVLNSTNENMLLEISSLKNKYELMQEELCKFKACDTCGDYKFVLTTTKMHMEETRVECQRQGGDLINVNLGPSGAKCHNKIRSVLLDGVDYYVGMKYSPSQQSWYYLNGIEYDPNGPNAWNWQSGEPNNGESWSCAYVYSSHNRLYDIPCSSFLRYGICEIKTALECT